MRVLVTGAGGFIGQHVVRLLAENGIECYRLLFPIHQSVKYADAVIHCAGVIPNGEDLDFSPNLSMAYELRQACPKYIVNLSSIDVYGQLGHQLTESSRVMPMTTYAASKLAAEYILEELPNSVTLRIAQVYGPDERPIKFIPTLLQKMLKGEQVELLGYGESSRSYIYVTDVARAALHCVMLGAKGIYNVGGPPMKISQVAELAFECLPTKSVMHVCPGPTMDFTIDSSKLMITEWRPLTQLHIGIMAQWKALGGK